MDARLLGAVQNNASWCDLVCRSVGIPTRTRPLMWVALRRSPPLYPDVVTLSPTATTGDVVHAVLPGSGASVKDSFATVDLEKNGFELRFEGRWIYRPPAHATASGRARWTVVDSHAELTEWLRSARDAVDVPREVFGDSAVRVLAATGPGGVEAGAIVNDSGPVVGVSNVFGTAVDDPATWTEIAAVITSAFPSLPIVGYERGDRLHAALAGGFEEIGALRVWLQTDHAADRATHQSST